MKSKNKKISVVGLGALFLIVAGIVCGGLMIIKGVGIGEDQNDVANIAGKEEAINGSGSSDPTTGEETGSSQIKEVEVRIVSSGVDDKMLYVAGEVSAIDDSGKCQYLIMDYDERVLDVVEADAIRNPRTVTCSAIEKPIETLGEGPWRVKLVYNSLYVFGESKEVRINAQ